MDEIICANTAFRYWRCPPQVRDLYPRLPNSDDGWRALSRSPFVTDVLKTPITAVASPGCCNHHSVFLVTHDMLNDSKQLDTIARSVCDRLGIRYKAKTEAMKSAETRLRANVLCNWLEIGN